jgi:hypothetical protein
MMEMPTVEQFLDVIDVINFGKLSGQKDTKIDPSIDFIELPNHVMTHPWLFTVLDGSGETKAKIAGALLVQSLTKLKNKADEANKNEVQEFINGCHLTLAYLWATCKGLIYTEISPSEPSRIGHSQQRRLIPHQPPQR